MALWEKYIVGLETVGDFGLGIAEPGTGDSPQRHREHKVRTGSNSDWVLRFADRGVDIRD